MKGIIAPALTTVQEKPPRGRSINPAEGPPPPGNEKAPLSGGAKEQLGILARLAGAALVAKEDAVPILIDDALGFSDPGRLAKMAEVFDTLGERGQVIVLTCTPARYDGVKGAQRIELCA